MKRLIYILIVNCFLLIDNCYAQPSITWQRYYTNPIAFNNYGTDICKSDSGNFFVVGTIGSAPPSIYIIKINAYGDTIWTKIIQAFGAYSGVSSGDGGCVITGTKFTPPNQPYSIKLDAEGNIVWKNYYAASLVTCHKIIKCSDNGYIACGEANYYSGYAMKIDSLGNLEWQKIYAPIYYKLFKSVTEAFDGGYILMGTVVDSPTEAGKGLITKIDSTGSVVWERTYFYGVVFEAIEKLNNGYVIGRAALDTNLNRGIVSIVKIDCGGNIYSVKNYGPNILRNYYVTDVKKLDNGRLAILYHGNSANADTIHGAVYVTDTNGVVLRETTFSGATETKLLRILPLANGDIMLVGNTNFLNIYTENAYVVKVDTNLYAPPIRVQNISKNVPSQFRLFQNYPNPFNPITKIKFQIPSSKKYIVRLSVFDILGKELEVLLDQELEGGTYEAEFKGMNYSSGVYFCRLSTNNYSETKKMVLLK